MFFFTLFAPSLRSISCLRFRWNLMIVRCFCYCFCFYFLLAAVVVVDVAVCVFHSNWYCCTIIITLCLSCFWLLCAQLKQLIDAIYMYLQLVGIIHWWAKLLFLCSIWILIRIFMRMPWYPYKFYTHIHIEIYMHRICVPRISYTISHPYLIYYTGIECNCYIANMN